MERDFNKVLQNVVAIAPDELIYAINRYSVYWKPEEEWEELKKAISQYVLKSSENPQSIAIYSEFYGIGFAETKSLFKEFEL